LNKIYESQKKNEYENIEFKEEEKKKKKRIEKDYYSVNSV